MVLRLCDFDTFYSPTGGGVRQYHERKLAFYADRDDVCYTLIVPGAKDEQRRFGNARRYLIAAPAVPGAPNYRWIPRAAPLRRILSSERPHLVEVGAPYLSPWLARWASRGLPIALVGFWHADYPATYVRAALARLGDRVAAAAEDLAWRYARLTHGRYRATLAASIAMVAELRRRGVGPVFHTPLGVDTDVFRPSSPAEGASSAPREIVYLGRLGSEKGLAVLLEAAPTVLRHHPDARLTVAGDGPLRSSVETLVEAHVGRVGYLGYVSDRRALAQLVANAALLVSPGGNETFGLTVLEAFSAGTPVVSADRGGAAELVQRCGVGQLFRAGRSDDLVDAIDGVLAWSESRRREAAARARAFVVDNYGWERVLERQLSCYRRILGRGGD